MSRAPAAVRALTRYRPYVVAVVAVALIAVVPGRGSTSPTASRPTTAVSTAAAASGGDVPAAASPASDGDRAPAAVAGSATATSVVAAATGAGQPAKSGVARAGTATPTAGAAKGTSGTMSYPGVGTPEALASPHCDKATGRLSIPSRYAPPCTAPWPQGSDNGGSTSTGVTADKVRMVVYIPSGTSSVSDFETAWQQLADIYNKHLQLWGRQLELVFFTPSGSDEVAQRADAIQVATSIKPFFATTATADVETFSSELAARGVVVFNQNVSWKATQLQAPYRWGDQQDDRITVMHTLEYVGKRLVGRPVKWAGTGIAAGSPRVFGTIFPTVWDKPFFDGQAAQDKVHFADELTYVQGDVPGAQERARTLISKLKADGVTTLVAGTDWTFNIILSKEATTQLYFPEWVITGWGFEDVALFARLNDQQQWQHAFGVGAVQAIPPASVYEIWALYRWEYGVDPPSAGNTSTAWTIFRTMFPCLSLAGPKLTPQSFRDGCFSFPPSGGSYCRCTATIGNSFGKRDGIPWLEYTAWADMTEKWWDPTRNGPDEAGITQTGGQYMKVDGAKRYTTGQWPTTEPKAFDPNGAVDIPSDYPPGEAPPSYPHW